MTRTKSTYLSVIALLLSPMAANANLIEVGNTTLDTSTGLEWLDLTETVGLGVDNFFADVGGYLSNGWSLATQSQICSLYANIGGIDEAACNESDRSSTDSRFRFVSDLSAATDFINLLGNTTEGTGYNTAIGSFASTSDGSYFGNACVAIDGFCNTGEAAGIGGYVIGNLYTPTRTGERGLYLTRTAAVPEPGTLGLLVIGLAGMGLSWSRRKV